MDILVVDDHPLVVQGLISVLSLEKNVNHIYSASNIDEAMNELHNHQIDFAIIDLKLGDEDGLEIVTQAKAKDYHTKLIILTSSIQKEDFLRAKAMNVDGYVLKKAYVEDILYAFHVISRGKKFYDTEILEYKTRYENSQLDELTTRELDVFMALGEGLDNNEIAHKLFISQNTVKKHMSNIMAKLEYEHRIQVAILASNMQRV